MLGLNILRNAITTLAGNVAGLANTVREINTNLRQRAALDAPEPDGMLTLDGTVPASVPGKGSGVAQDGAGGEGTPGTVDAPPAGGNGRRRKAADATAGR